jgi:hypothetical protein
MIWVVSLSHCFDVIIGGKYATTHEEVLRIIQENWDYCGYGKIQDSEFCHDKVLVWDADGECCPYFIHKLERG